MKLWAKKSLGQHFLNSRHVLEQIIVAAHIQKGEVVLEIGPGTGVLTTALLMAGANVIAVEKDVRACELLREKFAGEIANRRLKLIGGDILDPKIFDAQEQDLPAPYSMLPASYSLVANIPYYITGAILERFLEHEPRPVRMVLLVQKEVAERIVARPLDGKTLGKESILSISVKAFGTPRIIARVPRGAFTPPPTVDSAILSIENIFGAHFQGKDTRKFFAIVRAGFAHKRKLLIRNLERIVGKEKLLVIWKKLGLDEKVRAEDIPVRDWLAISAECN